MIKKSLFLVLSFCSFAFAGTDLVNIIYRITVTADPEAIGYLIYWGSFGPFEITHDQQVIQFTQYSRTTWGTTYDYTFPTPSFVETYGNGDGPWVCPELYPAEEIVPPANFYVDFTLDLRGEIVFDEYHWDVSVQNYDPLYDVIAKSDYWFENATQQDLVPLFGETLLHYNDEVSNVGFVLVKADSSDQKPTRLSTQIWYGREDPPDSFRQVDYNFYKYETGTTASGGDKYKATWIAVHTVGYTDPVDPPDGNDPPPPPPDDSPPPPPPPPPPDPDFPFDYDLFRQAVEIALANRNLSGKQIQDAVQNALENQGMDSEEIKKAVAAGTKDGTADVEAVLDRILKAIKDQEPAEAPATGTSSGTIASGIGQARTNSGFYGQGALTNAISAGVWGTNTAGEVGLTGSATNVAFQANDTIDFIDQWWGSFWTLDLPTSVGHNPVIDIPLAGTVPTTIFSWPDKVTVDVSSWSVLDLIRGIELLALNILMLFQVAHIFKAAW